MKLKFEELPFATFRGLWCSRFPVPGSRVRPLALLVGRSFIWSSRGGLLISHSPADDSREWWRKYPAHGGGGGRRRQSGARTRHKNTNTRTALLLLPPKKARAEKAPQRKHHRHQNRPVRERSRMPSLSPELIRIHGGASSSCCLGGEGGHGVEQLYLTVDERSHESAV